MIYDLWLDLEISNAVKKKNVLVEFGSSENYHFQMQKKQVCKVSLKQAVGMQKILQEKGIETVAAGDSRYPEQLRLLEDMPFLLYCQGDLSLLKKWPAVAVVGARKASLYGKWVAKELAAKMASNGVLVVSGMAYGIDAEAHWGALESGGKSIAVLGCGVDICYPRQNYGLKKHLENKGLVISEFPPGTKPKPHHFPLRNRIVSGLCRGTVVVEAGVRSGSLITAELAAEQGREVYAVPGPVNSPLSLGTNKLIKDGALPVTTFSDILLDWEVSQNQHRNDNENSLGEEEKLVYDILKNTGEMTAAELAKHSRMPLSKVMGLVTILEIKGHVNTYLGKIFIAF